MKIPFDVKYRPQIESGEYKVETKDGKPVRIICWDKKSEKKYGYHIVGLIEFGPQHEESTYYTIDGKGRLKDKEPDLFIITPEPELTKFEQEVYKITTNKVHFKEEANKLLELAKKELCKGCVLKEIDENRVYKYTGPMPQAYWPSCRYGGYCTNFSYDCINCPRGSITTAKMESK